MGYYSRMRLRGLRLTLIAVRSPDDEQPPGPTGRWLSIEAPNSPLSQKWNAGIAYAWIFKPDAVVLVGSDDLLNAAYFEYAAALPETVLYSELSSLYFYDLASGQCAFVPRFRVHPGRMFRRELLDRCRWRPYRGDLDRNVDSGTYWLTAPLSGEEKRFETPPGVVCIDVKGAENIWSFDEQRRKVHGSQWREADGQEVMNRHFPGFLERVNTEAVR